MAIAQQNELITEIRGSIGDRTFRYHNGTQIIQRRSSPGNHQTPAALQRKNRFAYSAYTLSQQIDSTKNRLRYLSRHDQRNFYNFFQSHLTKLAGTETTTLDLPGQASLPLEGVSVFDNPEGSLDVSWTTRSTDPNDWVEFIDGGYHSDGEFNGAAHFSVTLNTGIERIFSDTWVGIFFRTKNGQLTSPIYGQLQISKFKLDYSVKPFLPPPE